ncbi:hypothetical protein DMENIID0001_007880 [Sergentomyia squamirostris]
MLSAGEVTDFDAMKKVLWAGKTLVGKLLIRSPSDQEVLQVCLKADELLITWANATTRADAALWRNTLTALFDMPDYDAFQLFVERAGDGFPANNAISPAWPRGATELAFTDIFQACGERLIVHPSGSSH